MARKHGTALPSRPPRERLSRLSSPPPSCHSPLSPLPRSPSVFLCQSTRPNGVTYFPRHLHSARRPGTFASPLPAEEHPAVGIWNFDGTLADVSGRGNNAFVASPTFVPGHSGQGLRLAAGPAVVPDSPELRPAPRIATRFLGQARCARAELAADRDEAERLSTPRRSAAGGRAICLLPLSERLGTARSVPRRPPSRANGITCWPAGTVSRSGSTSTASGPPPVAPARSSRRANRSNSDRWKA